MFAKHQKKRIIAASFLISMALFWIFSCGWFGNNNKLVESTDYFMNTIVTVKIYVNNRNKGKELIERTLTEAKRIEKILVARNGDGELQKINSGSHDIWWKLSPELKAVIDRSFFLTKKPEELLILL